MNVFVNNESRCTCCGRPTRLCICGALTKNRRAADPDLLPTPSTPLVENVAGSVADPDPDGPLDRLVLNYGGRWFDHLDEEGIQNLVANLDDDLLLPPGWEWQR